MTYLQLTNSNDRPVVDQYVGHKRINSLFGSFVAGYKNYLFLGTYRKK